MLCCLVKKKRKKKQYGFKRERSMTKKFSQKSILKKHRLEKSSCVGGGERGLHSTQFQEELALLYEKKIYFE